MRHSTSDEAADQLKQRLGLSTVPYIVLLSFSCLLSFGAWLSIMQLLTFHIGLMSREMTTYEFIMAQVFLRFLSVTRRHPYP